MDGGEDNLRMALQIVFVLSSILVFMDLLELYVSYYSLIDYSAKLLPQIFDQCVKYHIITQMFFTVFATLAGFSACIMSIGLLINSNFFAVKLLDAFMYYNFYAFGPFLLSSTILSFIYFGQVTYNCDANDFSKQYLNFSTVICIIIAFIFSFIISVGYTAVGSFDLFNDSIKFNPEGNYVLGKIFWKYVFNRANETIHVNQDNDHLQLPRGNLAIALNENDYNNPT